MAKSLDWFRLRNKYGKYREDGWTAQRALHAARVALKWRDMRSVFITEDSAADAESFDWVPFIKEELDAESYDASYVDTWGLSEGRAKRIKDDILKRADEAGVFFYMAGYFAHGEVEIVDSIGGFIGEDFIGSGYDIELMEAAMDAAEEAQSQAVQRKLKEAMEEMT